MDIDPKIAQTIVANIKGALQHEINFFDTTGTIIASTDPTRIGTGHGGARLAVKLNQTIAIDNDHQYAGARNGINVPVLFNDSVVAVVGVTGKCEEVEVFGNVIKKMTEILIRENLDQITRFDQRMMMANLVTMLTFERRDAGLIDTLASVLQIDLQCERRAIVGRVTGASQVAALSDAMFEEISRARGDCSSALFSVTPQECCLFVDRRDSAGLDMLLEKLSDIVKAHQGARIAIGLGEFVPCCQEYWRSYEQASKTANWQLFTHASGRADYREMDYGIFMASIPQEEAWNFVNHTFAALNDRQIDEYQRIFEAYKLFDGSIMRASESLFIHKNTLQNRLNDIASATGYNPRLLNDYTVLDTAFRLRSYLQFQGTRTTASKGTAS